VVAEVGIGSEEVPLCKVGIIGLCQPECQFCSAEAFGVKEVVFRFERPGFRAVVFTAVGDHGGGVDLAQAAVAAENAALASVL